ncbi:MAG: hypothetical protein ACOZNI_02670 [Myxococcota bacterium]
MSLPLRLNAPVSLVYAVPVPPVLAKGTVVASDERYVEIRLDAPAAIPAGARVIVELPKGSAVPRAVIAVESSSGGVLRARIVRAPPPEKREYPRVHGAVDVGWRVARGDEEAWLAGGPAGELFHPDPFMNFSATGLGFDDHDRCAEGDTLLLEVGIPHDARRWRCLGKVVRVAPIPVDERDEDVDATHRIAVSLERAPDELTEALSTYTLKIQDAWLEGAS